MSSKPHIYSDDGIWRVRGLDTIGVLHLLHTCSYDMLMAYKWAYEMTFVDVSDPLHQYCRDSSKRNWEKYMVPTINKGRALNFMQPLRAQFTEAYSGHPLIRIPQEKPRRPRFQRLKEVLGFLVPKDSP